MPSWKDFYGSDYISTKDLQDGPVKTKILACSPQEIESGDGKSKTKLVCELESMEKSLALNATNAEILAKAYSDNYTKWIGKQIQLSVEPVKFGGKDVDGVRVKALSK